MFIKASRFSVVDSQDGMRYIIFCESPSGFSKHQTYHIHTFDKDTESINRKPVYVVQVEKTPNLRYHRYGMSAIGLIAFAVFNQHFSLFRKKLLTVGDLDNLYNQFIDDYNKGNIDTDLALYE